MCALRLPINNLSEIPDAIAALQLAGAGHRAPVLRGVAAGRIAAWEPQRSGNTGVTKKFLASVQRPALIIVGDDDDTPTGPAGWPLAERLLRWARGVMLHATGGQEIHYVAAVVAAQASGRFVLIECDVATVDAWDAAVHRWAPAAPKILVVPPDGVHPSPGCRETRQ